MGALDNVPSAFIFVNAGDSSICSRIQTEMPSRKIDSRNGMRQPQSANSFSPTMVRTLRITISDSSRPSVAVVWIQLV